MASQDTDLIEQDCIGMGHNFNGTTFVVCGPCKSTMDAIAGKELSEFDWLTIPDAIQRDGSFYEGE